MSSFQIINLLQIFTLSLFIQSQAFSPIYVIQHRQNIKQSSLSSLYGQSDDFKEGKSSSRTDINQFLTQRTIQTFMLLMKNIRDPHTSAWIEDFLGSSNCLSFHGTGLIDMDLFPTWDSVFTKLIEEPPDVVSVEIKASNSGNRLSKNNPYRESETKKVVLEIDIDPPSIVGRMISVREKIASEFVKDLDLLITANNEILSSYNQKCLDARENEEYSKDKNTESGNDNDDDRCSIEPLTVNSMSGDFNFGQRTTQTFDRTAVYMVNNHPYFNDPESTLSRSTSFDLLFLLSTQESIHRLLKSYMEAGESKEPSFRWLLDYYENSLEKYFDGCQSFGRADDFLDDLLLTPPSLKTIDGHVDLIDPFLIAEEIIDIREKVAMEWKEVLSLAASDHEPLRQAVFVKQMSKWGHKVEDIDPSIHIDEEVKEEIVDEVFGDMESRIEGVFE